MDMEQKNIGVGEVLFWSVVALLVIDFVAFWVWGLSGQFPADNFYLGSITRHILQAIIY